MQNSSLYAQPAQTPTPAQAAANATVLIFSLLITTVFLVLALIGLWKMYKKAGKPGWATLIPIYNTVVYLRIIARPWWWILLLLIPFVNIIVTFIMAVKLGKSFGKSGLFGFVWLGLFPIVGTLILGFGSAQYTNPGSGSGPASGSPAGPTQAPMPPAPAA